MADLKYLFAVRFFDRVGELNSSVKNQRSIILVAALFLLGTAILFSGCVTIKYDQAYISENIQKLSSYSSARSGNNTAFQIPAQVSLEKGIGIDEAISIALFNNARFQADLINISIINADLITAGQLPNPLLSIIFPTGTDPLKGTLNFALDGLWKRPIRIRAATLETERTALQLVNTGLQLIRDVRLAYADYLLADERLKIGMESLRIRGQMARIIKKQYEAGDISEMEATLAIADSLQAQQEELRAVTAATASRYRLLQLMGIDSLNQQFAILPLDNIPQMDLSASEILDTARLLRTDLKAAQLGIEAKGKQLGWERSRILSFTAILSVRKESDGLAFGPGFAVGLPIFPWNKGKVLRTQAELEQAAWNYLLVKRNIGAEVYQAYAEWEAAIENYTISFGNEQALAKVPEQVRKAYEAGEVSYYFYLETLRRVIDIQLRFADARVAIYKAIAKLNYAAGKKQL